MAKNHVDDFVVNFFDPVVTLLIESIDRTFYSSDLGIANVRAASDVFLVPELEVEAVLCADGALKARIRIVNVFVVPTRNGIGL